MIRKTILSIALMLLSFTALASDPGMTLISATQVSLTTYVKGEAWAATSSAAALTMYIQCDDSAGDGLHATKRQGEYEQANCASMQPA